MASWALVLGASSGFGAAAARAFAAEGRPIFGIHLDLRATRERADAVRDAIIASGVHASMHNINAADDRRRTQALDDFQSAHDGQIGVVVHSLAFGSLRPYIGADRTAPKDLDMTLSVMAHSLVWWVQDLLDRDLLAPGARVFALTSEGSQRAMAAYGPVSAAKACLEAHVRQLARELAPRDITVNAIMPGIAHTPALEVIPGWEDLAERERTRNPKGRLTTPEDVADALVALSAPGTAWMTGNVIRVDGGSSVCG